MKKKFMFLAVALSMILSWVSLPIPVTAAPAIIYVDTDASGANDGASWADAYNYLQDALADAETGDEIWVAEGTYRPDEGSGQTAGDRSATFQLVDGVAIYGGFVGGETSLGGRSWQSKQTILSGDLEGNDGSDFRSRGENSYHVMTGDGIGATAILDGFIIAAGNSDSYDSPDDAGGGMWNNYSNPTLSNCTFYGNSAGGGGGMWNNYSNPTLTNCIFSGNGVEWSGGGMSNSSSSPTLTNCIFSGNGASDGSGGGMVNYSSSPTLVNCTFSKNYSSAIGGGMTNSSGSPTLTNCTFCGNRAIDNGGGMYNAGSDPTLTNCTFSGNQAGEPGGGMYNAGGSPTLTNCTFSGNTADYGGGGISDSNSSLTLTNCILWGNSDSSGTGESAQVYSGTLAVNYCCLQGWTGALGGTGNIGANPLFVDADGPDNVVGTIDDNLRLSVGSPCIDTGYNSAVPIGVTTDLDGHPRIVNGVVDIGAYEYSGTVKIGTINVTSTPAGASFALSGPASYNDTTPWSVSNAPVPLRVLWRPDQGMSMLL